jgi:hypothetical protein
MVAPAASRRSGLAGRRASSRYSMLPASRSQSKSAEMPPRERDGQSRRPDPAQPESNQGYESRLPSCNQKTWPQSKPDQPVSIWCQIGSDRRAVALREVDPSATQGTLRQRYAVPMRGSRGWTAMRCLAKHAGRTVAGRWIRPADPSLDRRRGPAGPPSGPNETPGEGTYARPSPFYGASAEAGFRT